MDDACIDQTPQGVTLLRRQALGDPDARECMAQHPGRPPTTPTIADGRWEPAESMGPLGEGVLQPAALLEAQGLGGVD